MIDITVDLSAPWFTCILGSIKANPPFLIDTLITCPNCKTKIPLSETFKHEIEAGALATERARHQRELDAAVKSAETAAIRKASNDAARHEASPRAEAAEEKERNRKLLVQLEEMTTDSRALRRKDEEHELAYKQQLAAEEERIRAEARKKIAAEYQLQCKRPVVAVIRDWPGHPGAGMPKASAGLCG